MKVAILGAGESGVGAALLAQRLGFNVWVSDAATISGRQKEILQISRVPFEEGQHTWEQFFDADVVVKSPGIPPTASFVQRLKEIDKSVISEIEFASQHAQAPIIAITGSNGKTTTTSLIHHLLISAGVDAGLGGNIGNSFCGLLLEAPKAVYVVEVSSFQLEDIDQFHPCISLFLNLTPDHLDRYQGSMDLYGTAKMRITENQTAEDSFIFSLDDPESQRVMKQHRIHAKMRGFSLKPNGQAAACILDGNILLDGETWGQVSNLPLLGPHNQWNVMAALLALKAWGLTKDQVLPGLTSFQPIAHRLQPVGEGRGIRFVNDSKATNVDAVQYALEAMDGPVIWLAGGVDKGNDYTSIQALIDQKVKSLIVLGNHDEKLKKIFSGPVLTVDSMKKAIEKAGNMAQPGDTVLLSPACASFDLFRNYEDRGDQFVDAVDDWIARNNTTTGAE